MVAANIFEFLTNFALANFKMLDSVLTH